VTTNVADATAATRTPATQALGRLPVVLAALTVLLQIAYPLVSGEPRNTLTVVTVAVFCLASTSHALLHRGVRWTGLYLLVTGGFGLLAEAVGTATGVPFGQYDYADTLGGKLLGVPVVIPMAWAMFAYPCLLVGQRLARSALGATVVGAVALASWDLFLDPQMVEAGHWRFTDVQASLPGAPGIPLSNYLGWLLVATLMIAALQLLGRRDADDRVPAALFLWTYASSVLANAVFFGRPAVALLGGLGMGLVAIPYALSLRRP
jgi:putative membrane protein